MGDTPWRIQIEASCLQGGSSNQPWKFEDEITPIGTDHRVLQGLAWTRRDLQRIGAAATNQRGGLNSSNWIGEPHLAITNPRCPLGLQTPLPNLAVHALLQKGLIADSLNHKFHAFVAAAQAQVHGALTLSPDCSSTSEPEHHIALNKCKAANQHQWNQPGGSRGDSHA
ncbi:hypothetical protein [Synechococcus sp. PROS-9-1]|uniref:hypothetical protein n=1 Tax=Synechococcus sp. PROS-9-1 TaxID=1968775 RepID=UPI00351C53AD